MRTVVLLHDCGSSRKLVTPVPESLSEAVIAVFVVPTPFPPDPELAFP
jgi:hypothetical protein